MSEIVEDFNLEKLSLKRLLHERRRYYKRRAHHSLTEQDS